jgi:ubiquitin-conjugating enzyme E2 J1
MGRLRTFMETDPKGQLGGLECTDDMRRRMAKASQSWKCPSCGKSNQEILTACEEASRNADSVKPDVEVPKELKMGWRDEMGKSAEGNGETSADDAESAALAEGFVQTAPIPAESGQESQTESPTQTLYPPAQPAQTVPQPTATTPLPPMPPQPAAVNAIQRRQSNDGVPEWVDKAIIGIAACLIVMILKVLLGIWQGSL